MLMKTRAIVLRTLKYGERQLIADLLTEQAGRISCIVNMPKTARGRNRKQLYQPMMLLDIEFDLRPTAQLQRIRDVRIDTPYSSIPFDPYKLSITLFLSEFLLHATRGEQQNAALYQYVAASMQWLDMTTRPAANFHLVFIMRLAQFIGFTPNLDDYHEGDFFDLRSATFTSSAPLHNDFLRGVEAMQLRQLMRMRYETMHLFRLSREQRNRILELLLVYYSLHLPAFPELHSLGVVQELFT